MIQEPICSRRECRHFGGVRNDGDEGTERVFCLAFPDRIPDEIAWTGENAHAVPVPDQGNEVVYEHGTRDAEELQSLRAERR